MKVFLFSIPIAIANNDNHNNHINNQDNISISDENDPLLQIYKRAIHSPHCGRNWYHMYTKEVLNHHQNNSSYSGIRYLLFASRDGGLNDRLSGLVTAFYSAFISKRTLQIYSYDGVAPFEEAFDYSNYNWSISNLNRNFASEELKINDHYNKSIVLDYTNTEYPLLQTKQPEDLELLFSSSRQIILRSNRGKVYDFITNSKYGSSFIHHKMNPLYGAYCAFYNLFRPNQQVLQMARKFSEQLKSKNIIKIGIQIRTGDAVIQNMTYPSMKSSDYYENFFKCAKHLTRRIISESSKPLKVVWYLISDSLTLRQDAMKIFGNDYHIITNIDEPTHHSAMSRVGHYGEYAIRQVAAEILTFSMCDYFVLSHDSGLGKLGAYLAENKRDGSVYFEDRYNTVSDQESCSKSMTWTELGMSGTGP
eukprot:gene14273-19150_t